MSKEEQRLEAVQHICYEVWMLVEVAKKIFELTVEERRSDVVRYYSYMESFGIHYRALFDFLTNDKPYEKFGRVDVLAKDYLAEIWIRNKRKYDKYKQMRDYKVRVGFCIAHLSDGRMAKTICREKWPIEKMVDFIRIGIDHFVNNLKPKYQGCFDDLKAQEWPEFPEGFSASDTTSASFTDMKNLTGE